MVESSKILIVAQSFPPAVGGSSIILNNIFSDYKGEMMAIAGHPNFIQRDINFIAPCKTVYFSPLKLKILERYYEPLLKHLHFLLKLYIKYWAKKFKPNVIFSHCPDIDFFICAFQVAEELNIPFYAHMHDLWEENHSPDSYNGYMAKIWEKRILIGAEKVFCMTEIQQEFYKKKYNRNAHLLIHSITESVLKNVQKQIRPVSNNIPKILFTGNVSPVLNLDSLKVFSNAVRLMPSTCEVTLCTSLTKSRLLELGIQAEDFIVKWVSRDEAQNLQKTTDILFAPLSFKNGGIDEVMTVYSTKLLEYLISGRPILIFAPINSFHWVSAQKYGWAHIVDVDTEEALRNGILELINDKELQNEVVANAFKEAERRRSSIQAENLLNMVNSEINNSK
jgi:glycosyltransferase involved in cell wall biosynthesis